jgi:hypothetical protein
VPGQPSSSCFRARLVRLFALLLAPSSRCILTLSLLPPSLQGVASGTDTGSGGTGARGVGGPGDLQYAAAHLRARAPAQACSPGACAAPRAAYEMSLVEMYSITVSFSC